MTSGFSVPRAKLSAIMEALGYTKVRDAFDFQDVGNTKLNKAFHIEQGTITPESHDQATIDVDNPQTVRFYNKGNTDTDDVMTVTLLEADSIMNEAMDISARIDGIRNVMFSEFSAVPHSDDNNKIVRGELTLIYKQVICPMTAK